MLKSILAAGLFLTAAIVNAQHTLVVMGSSTVAGVGASTYDSSFAGRYAKYLPTLSGGWKMVNLGVSGYTTYQLMPTGFKHPSNRPAPDTAHNMTKALSLHPDVILFALTANDIGNNYAATEYEANYDSLNNLAKKAGVRIWFTTPLPRTALDSTGRAKILAFRKRVLERYAPRTVDFFDSLGAADGKYLPIYNSGDGIHTNNLGHKLLFNRVVAANLTELPTIIAGRSRGLGGSTVARMRLSGNGILILAAGLPQSGIDARGRVPLLRR
ncbi:MAG: lipolytic protein family [Fibrobacteres bacterium]|nr:lipolytic protein family [Fibrobacterota bacterium]